MKINLQVKVLRGANVDGRTDGLRTDGRTDYGRTFFSWTYQRHNTSGTKKRVWLCSCTEQTI